MRLLASQVRVLKNPIVETKIFLNLVANEYTNQWDDIPIKRACRIRAITNGDVSDEAGHQALIDWMMAHQLKIKAVIKPLVEQLSDDYWTSQG